MMNTFQILEEFLAGQESEVSGRGMAPLTAELRDKLERFLRHELTEEEQRDFWSELLGPHPALEQLALLIKAGDPPQKPG